MLSICYPLAWQKVNRFFIFSSFHILLFFLDKLHPQILWYISLQAIYNDSIASLPSKFFKVSQLGGKKLKEITKV